MDEDRKMQGNTYADYRLIVGLVASGSKILDLGCGKGELLELLTREKQVRGMGVDIDQENIIYCIEKGLTVFQADLDEGLLDHPDQSYDCVILNRTIQVVHKPHQVIKEMLRVGKQVIVGFPNFANLPLVAKLLFTGKMPKSEMLPYEWFDTPNIHLLTINDFRQYCLDHHIRILRQLYIRRNKVFSRGGRLPAWLANYLVDEAIFVITANEHG